MKKGYIALPFLVEYGSYPGNTFLRRSPKFKFVWSFNFIVEVKTVTLIEDLLYLRAREPDIRGMLSGQTGSFGGLFASTP